MIPKTIQYFKQTKSILKPGDLMFTFSPGSLISEGIAFFTRQVLYHQEPTGISHVQVFLESGIDGNIHVISAEAKGLVSKWIIVPGDLPQFYCFKACPSLTDQQREIIVKWLKDNEGADYNYWGLLDFILNINFPALLNIKHVFFCSQAAHLAYVEAGMPLMKDIAPDFVSPRDLYTASILEEVR